MSGGSTYDGSSYKAELGLSPGSLLASTQPYAGAVRAFYGIKTATYTPEVKQLFGDLRYVLSSRHTTQQMNRVAQPGYLYMLSYIPPSERNNWRGAPHSWQKRPLFRDEGITIINDMRQYIVNLVKTGNPNSIGLPDWPPVSAGKIPWMMFGNEPKIKLDIWQEKLELLQRVYEHRITPMVAQ
tara:strand:- start:368 stop:916 length:549 start_codon:yes stop_codon:yes gene_type:complete